MLFHTINTHFSNPFEFRSTEPLFHTINYLPSDVFDPRSPHLALVPGSAVIRTKKNCTQIFSFPLSNPFDLRSTPVIIDVSGPISGPILPCKNSPPDSRRGSENLIDWNTVVFESLFAYLKPKRLFSGTPNRPFCKLTTDN
jgi:hypothetical protein